MYTLRQIQRDKSKAVAASIAANKPVAVDTRAYIVPVSWLDYETDEQPARCVHLKSAWVQSRVSATKPIPLRFGYAKEIKAWLISLARWEEIR